MSTTATRLITLLMLLQRQPNQKAAALAEQLGVSVRTVQRYILMLDEMGIPVYAERGPHGGYALVRGYRMPPLVFTPQEAVAVYLGTGLVAELWGELYRAASGGALAKLDNVLPEEQRHEVAWAQRSMVATGLHRADWPWLGPLLEKMRRAIRERRRVHLVYRGRAQVEPLHRDVDPYALVHRWGWWYVVGYCHLRLAIRSFRVDRVLELTLLDTAFDIAEDFDVQTYLDKEPHTQPTLRVSLHFSADGALLALDDRAFWDSITELADGSVQVVFSVPNLEVAARVVLGYAPYAVVLEPDVLRTLMRERALAIAAQYQDKATGSES